jgi:SRSO17 transposase
MSLLERPEAQELLQDATMAPQAVRGCAERLSQFVARYLPLFGRAEQRQHARLAIEGRLSGLERKTSEPIAREADVPRRALQRFVGAGDWDDEVVMAELRRQVIEALGDSNGVLVLDPSSFPKKGQESCGVQRQWCGRLGKTDNCQVGVFLAYAVAKGHVPLDRQLYLPEGWAKDKKRRQKCHVPPKVKYQPKWQIGLDLVKRSRDVPHAWVTGDDEFGRVSEFREALRKAGEHYVLDVPCNTLVRDLDEPVRRRADKGKGGRPRKAPFRRVDAWAARQPADRWQTFEIRAGEKGPLKVQAIRARVQTRTKGRVSVEETLVVIRTREAEPRTYYTLSDAAPDVATLEITRAHAERHRVEEMLQEGKGEVGLGHYEVRSWTGWHHHMTLCSLALLFLVLEKLRLGGKNPGCHGTAGACHLHRTVAASATDLSGDRQKSQRGAAA